MKKGFKITFISLGTLLGLLLIAVGIALWIVFTPSRLTSMVNSLSNKYLSCDSSFEHVELTLFSTFPNLGLEVHDVAIVNPMEGAPSDTLLSVGRLVVGFDVKAFMKGGNIVVRQLQLDDGHANLFVNAEGKSNFDLFPTSDDTTSKLFQMPDSILLHSIAVERLSATYIDMRNSTNAAVNNLSLHVDGEMRGGNTDAAVDLKCGALSYSVGDSLTTAIEARDLALSVDGCLHADKMNTELVLDAGRLAYRSGMGVSETMLTELYNGKVAVTVNGDMKEATGRLTVTLPQAQFQMSGTEYCTQTTAKHGDLLSLDIPFRYSMMRGVLQLDSVSAQLDGRYRLGVDGSVTLPATDRALSTDVAIYTNRWDVAGLLAVVPAKLKQPLRGMDLSAGLQLQATCKGDVSDSMMPRVDATLQVTGGRWADKRVLADAIEGVSGTLHAHLVPTGQSKNPYAISAKINNLKAHWRESDAVISAEAKDIAGKMPFVAQLQATVKDDDIKTFMPDSLALNFSGTALLRVAVNANLNQLQQQDWQHVQCNLQLQMRDLNVTSDSLHVTTPNLTFDASLHDAGTMPGVLFQLITATTHGNYGSMGGNATRLSVRGKAVYDASKQDWMQMLQPSVVVDIHEATLYTPAVQQLLRLNNLHADYKDGNLDTLDASIVCGLSDYRLQGSVSGVGNYFSDSDMLRGTFSFSSGYTDVDQLMSMFSGMGTDKDTLAEQRKEASTEANPFIVPRNIDIKFNTHIDNCVAFGNKLSNVNGGLTVNDGVVVLDQMGFVCKAARMQLTGVYRSPRFNHLFTGLDFHLLDIQIDELIDMIPCIDTLVPMLKSFNGNADFHLAAETYLTAEYKPKYSTMLGAAAISGKDLVVMDNETFDKISSLLMFKKRTQNKIDSLDVEMTVFRNELEVFPFLLSMDKYQVCVAGRHNLDNNCNYHLELLKSPLPFRLAVDVKGTIKKPKISLGKVRYADLFKPEKQNKLQERTLEIKRQVRQALERNVKNP